MPETGQDLLAAVRQLLLYTLWADRICLKAVEAVSPEDLVRPTGTSFGTLLGTLAHTLCAQRRWLARCEGKPLDPVPGVADFPDGETLQAGWVETAAELGFFLAALSAEQLAADLTFTWLGTGTVTMPLWKPLLHLVNHSTYHRGQAVSLLRQLGYVPPATDLDDFFWEQAQAAAALPPVLPV